MPNYKEITRKKGEGEKSRNEKNPKHKKNTTTQIFFMKFLDRPEKLY
jgi:hypothetical protein